MPLNPPITDWQGRRCWIVGASTGIGAALADLLAKKGAKVALSARRVEPLKEMAARYGKGNALVLPLDITDAAALESAAKAIDKAWGGLDLVVPMAGEYKPMRATDIDLAVARTMIEVNLMGYLNVCAAVVPRLVKQKSGEIALVSSVAGYRGLPKSLIYGPTKAAIINLAETMYLDLVDHGVAVAVINPGFVRTPLTAQNEFEMPNIISPEEAAESIVAGFEAGEFEIHFPKAFSRKLKLLRHFPYGMYFKAIRKSTGL
jgi:NADP-dependent 3-hydroxy acid dehydrogenase YdfG